MPTSFFLRALIRLPVLLAALLLCGLAPDAVQAQDHAHHSAAPAAKRVRHPAPRPGITARNVLAPDAVPERSREVYTMAARIPSVLDGLYCHCDCHERDEKRSLLECFEDTMASTCGICSGQAELAYELHQDGKSLRQIRKAIDTRFGG
ncbi:PCYCGC motif-containing (lipo)protein [Longimicrobium sp.]|uniref:PCYCGC motif-containing (lipo)protein n=1 Tax=Longimicrobium sp. TaxID=2029185 RepID=UPI003B3A0FFA